jgi:hypothetical protein
MGTTQLQLYNLALLHVTDRNLTTTTDAVAARYALDDAYAGAIDHCLSQGYWNFAMRQSEETDDAEVTIGYKYQFTKPTDCVRLYNLYADSSLSTPLLRYEDKGGKWYAEIDTLYAVYVSNHATLGGGLLSAWPQLFTNYVALYLARMICNRVGAGSLFSSLAELEVRALRKALAVDGTDEPVRFPPKGGWVSSRRSGANQSRAQS